MRPADQRHVLHLPESIKIAFCVRNTDGTNPLGPRPTRFVLAVHDLLKGREYNCNKAMEGFDEVNDPRIARAGTRAATRTCCYAPPWWASCADEDVRPRWPATGRAASITDRLRSRRRAGGSGPFRRRGGGACSRAGLPLQLPQDAAECVRLNVLPRPGQAQPPYRPARDVERFRIRRGSARRRWSVAQRRPLRRRRPWLRRLPPRA